MSHKHDNQSYDTIKLALIGNTNRIIKGLFNTHK